MVSLLVAALGSLALTPGRQATWSSTSDRNHEAALGVAEAGVQKVMARMEAQKAGAYSGECPYLSMVPGDVIDSASCDGSTDQGPYELEVTRTADGFRIDSLGRTGGSTLGRGRRVLATILPPRMFPEDSSDYALVSKTSIDLKNNDHVFSGDIFANDGIRVESNAIINGSVTSARSWVQTESGTTITNIWSGGYNTEGSAVDVRGTVTGWVKASAANPADCTSLPNSNYDVMLGDVDGSVTTLGSVLGTPGGGSMPATCTQAAAPKELTPFYYDPQNYATDPPTLHEFTGPNALADFNAWRENNPGPVHGTFYIMPPYTPTAQLPRVDLTGWSIDGTTTIITNYPVFTGDLNDDSLPDGATAKFVVVSHYAPATGTSCDVNHDDSACAIHAKNHFQASCRTASLLYAENGPVAMKNNSRFCGAVLSNGILIKNNQELNYDEKIDHVIGFGRTVWGIAKWEEAKP
jgi:hypothetical protein